MIYEKTGRLSCPVFCAFYPYTYRQAMLKIVRQAQCSPPQQLQKTTRGNYIFSIKQTENSKYFY